MRVLGLTVVSPRCTTPRIRRQEWLLQPQEWPQSEQAWKWSQSDGVTSNPLAGGSCSVIAQLLKFSLIPSVDRFNGFNLVGDTQR